MPRSSNYERIYGVVRKIPKGKVATYGQVARLAGMPQHARQVGYALHVLPERANVPWHRVINSKGEISFHLHDVSNSMQKALLRKEGVLFDAENRVSLNLYGWRP